MLTCCAFTGRFRGSDNTLLGHPEGRPLHGLAKKKTLYVCLLSVVCCGRSLRSGSSADPALLNLPEFTLNNLNLPKFT